MIKVLIVEHFLLARSGIRRSLEEQGDIAVVGEAGTSDQAIALARRVARSDIPVLPMV